MSAKAAYNTKDYYDAINRFNKCADLHPDNYEVYFYRGLCKYLLFDNLGAEQDFTLAINNYNTIYVDAYNYRSLTRYRLGKFADAIDDIDRVIENSKPTPDLYLERAFYFLANSNFDASIEDCKKASAQKSLSEQAFFCKAQAEDALMKYDSALVDYSEVLRVNPKSYETYAFMGMAKFKLKRTQEALNDFQTALKFDSTCTLAYYYRAEVEARTANFKAAMIDYNNVLKYEPRNSYAYFGRGILYANMERYSNALSDFNKVIQMNPNNIEALFNRGKLKYITKDYHGAINDYDKIVSLFPYFIEVYSNRSQAKYSLKDYKGAQKDLETGKLMSTMSKLHTKETFDKDSLLLVKYTYLSADFHYSSDMQDNVDNNLLPVFYITQKDSSNYKTDYYSTILEDFNWKNTQNLCFKNINAFDKDSSLAASLLKLPEKKSDADWLVIAFYMSNMLQYDEAGKIFDSVISKDSLNVLAWFSRGVNTCRQIQYMMDNEEYSSDAMSSIQKEKCNAAIADFGRVIKLQPGFSFAYYNRAYVKCLLNDLYGANYDYEMSIKKSPHFADAYFNNGFLLFYLNYKQAACESFSKAGQYGIQQAFYILKKYCSGSIY